MTKNWFGELELTCYGICPETREWENKLKCHFGNRKSRVSDIASEDLLWMLEGLMNSFGSKKGDYGMYLIPMTLCENGMKLIVDTGIKLDGDIRNISCKACRMLELLGLPTNVITANGNEVYFEWTRNIVVWF